MILCCVVVNVHLEQFHFEEKLLYFMW